MPTRNDLSPSPSPTPQDLAVQEVLTCFDAYARIRAARDGVLSATRISPREEEHAFGDLQQAITRLRTVSRPR